MPICETCLHRVVCGKYKATGGVNKCEHYAEERHGRWEKRTDVFGFVRCSVCHDCNIYDDWPDGKKWKYCPHCGTPMDGGNADG